MRHVGKLSAILGVGVFILAGGCASKNGADNGGAGGTGFDPNSGNNGGTAPNGFPAAQNYTDPTTNTTDGLYPVTADVAAKLKNAASVCAGRSAEPEGSGSAIMEFVMDITSSMAIDSSDPTNPNAPSKWTVFSQTMPSVFAALPANFAVGGMYFAALTNPDRCYTANANDVPIATNNAAQSQALQTSVRTVQPNGATPTYQAWHQALQTVTAWQPGATDSPDLATAKRYIVLITDGVPTMGQAPNDCVYLRNGITQAEYDAELKLISNQTGTTGVKTFVVGVVGSNNPQNAVFDPLYYLSKIAVIGGTETPQGCVPTPGTVLANDVQPRGHYCHYDLSASQNLGTDLSNALKGIAGSVLPCTYTVPPDPSGQAIDPNKTILVFTDGANGATSVVLQNTSSTSCDQGWHFTDGTNSQIEVCGQTCKALQSNSMSSLSLVFGCAATSFIG